MSVMFKFLKIFVFLLSMQALRHGGFRSDNNTVIFLLDNDENYACISMK